MTDDLIEGANRDPVGRIDAGKHLDAIRPGHQDFGRAVGVQVLKRGDALTHGVATV